MKTVPEILAEIERLTGTGPDDSYDAGLEDIKQFILSRNMCEHGWEYIHSGWTWHECRKCGAKK